VRVFPSAIRVVGSVLLVALLLIIPATIASAGDRPFSATWVAVGLGLAPSPYGLDGNGSPVGDICFGKGIGEQLTVNISIAHFEFFGITPAHFTPASIGIRAHLSKNNSSEGGPYFGAATVVCHAVYLDRGVSETRLLPGLELAVGTVIPISQALAIDWSASHLLTPDADDLSPDPLTHSTKRDGLDRGMVRVRLVLRR